VAAAFRQLVEETSSALALPAHSLGEFALRAYDLIQFQDVDYAQTLCAMDSQPAHAGSGGTGFEVTKSAIWNLHKVMIIKDEVYVAHLLTSEEKQRRDRARYQVDPSRGMKSNTGT